MYQWRNAANIHIYIYIYIYIYSVCVCVCVNVYVCVYVLGKRDVQVVLSLTQKREGSLNISVVAKHFHFLQNKKSYFRFFFL